MEKYIPDMYQKSIFNIDFDVLYKDGIKCLLIDLENTVVPMTVKEPTKKVKELFDRLKTRGFKVIIFSNAPKSRVKPFKVGLDVDCCANARKPFKGKYLDIMKKYNFNKSQVACIGDQLFTDIKGGNKVGIKTILVNPIGNKERLVTKLARVFENKKFEKLRRNDLFIKGKYYE